VVAGWVLLTQVLSNHDAPEAPPRGESHSAGVTIAIRVIDGPTLYCATSANGVAIDNYMAVTASHVRDVMRELGCWEPNTLLDIGQ
jgi:hypothetical protein